jgi:hypothetical protein
LLVAEMYQLDNLFIPPAVPCARFLLVDALASRGEDAGVVPPSAVDKVVGVREGSDRRVVPELGIREGSFEDLMENQRSVTVGVKKTECLLLTGIIKVVDVDVLDGVDGRELLVEDGPPAHGGYGMGGGGGAILVGGVRRGTHDWTCQVLDAREPG